jgi:uncharacterized protein YggE
MALGLSACAGAAASPGQPEHVRSISVNGTGSITVTPDMAVVWVGVQTMAEDAQRAVDQNNDISAAIMAAVSELGVAANDVQTTNFSVWPDMRYDENGQITEIHYMVNNTVQVTVRQLDLLGDVLSEAVEAGANSISGIQFDLADREAANAQALELAMANAHSRAEVFAGAADVEIGEVQSLSTYIGGYYAPYRDMGFGYGGMGGAEGVSVLPGEMEIVVEVNVVFEIQ